MADVVVSGNKSDTQATALQSKPASATIITQQQVQDNNIENLDNAKQLQPSLQIRFGNPGVVNVNVRGIGQAYTSFADTILSGTPIYVDDVYQPRAAISSFGIPDLNGVNVLKGPQGTSGGQDSTGGTVNVTTELPSFVTSTKVEGSYGSYNLREFKGTTTGAIDGSDWAAFRIGINVSDRDGWIGTTNGAQELNSWHSDAIRGQVLLTPTQDLTDRIIFDFAHMQSSCCAALFAGAVTNYANGAAVSNNFYARAARLGYTAPTSNPLSDSPVSDIVGAQAVGQESWGVSNKLDYLFNGYAISSVSAFRGWDFHPTYQNNGTISPQTTLAGYGYPRELSAEQDLKISTPKGQTFESTAGVFYFFETYRKWSLTEYGSAGGTWFGNPTYASAVNNAAFNYAARQAYDNPLTNSVAPYIQNIWHATSNFDVTTGVRYSYVTETATSRWYWTAPVDGTGLTAAQLAQATAERKSNLGLPTYGFTASTHAGLVSYLVSGLYHFNADVAGYATYSRGGHGGGINFVANLPTGAPETIRPETIDNYEVGFKTQWFDQKLQANIAAFAMVDRNYITNVTDTSGATPISYLANAKRAISRGVELDVRAKVTDELTTYGSLTYDDAYYGSFASAPCPYELSNASTSCSFTGKPLSMTPKWALSVGGEYRQNLGAILPTIGSSLVGYASANYTWQSSEYSTTDDSIYGKINPYGLLNLRLGIADEKGSWDLSGWVKNALDTHYWVSVSAATGLGAGVIGGNPGDPLMAGVTLRETF